MTSRVSTLEVRSNLGDILNRVSLRQDQYIIERKGKALAALVSIEKLEQFQLAARAQLSSMLDRSSSILSQEQVELLANDAKHKSRKTKSSLNK